MEMRQGSVVRATARGLRFTGAGFVLLNGGVHLYLWDHGYREIRVIGPLFLLNAVVALLIASALVWKPEGFIAVLGLAFSVVTFSAFMLAVTVGAFNFVAGWDQNAVLAAVGEIGAILVLASWWVITRRKRGAPALGERTEGGVLT